MIHERAHEIAEFLNIPEAAALARLSQGFGALHAEVNADFRRANPQTDEELLEWYRSTESYIWELTAYHLDPGFNYSGMCQGIAERLKADDPTTLCLGDGIGDLTLTLDRAGMFTYYHDLAGSRTADFAQFRYQKQTGRRMMTHHSNGWEPGLHPNMFDAVVSLDFLEHVTSLRDWTSAIYAALKPGGLFCAQNAFDCGSGPDGAIPCHLKVNDKYAHAAPGTNGMALWDHLLTNELGFQQLGPNWYRKPA